MELRVAGYTVWHRLRGHAIVCRTVGKMSRFRHSYSTTSNSRRLDLRFFKYFEDGPHPPALALQLHLKVAGDSQVNRRQEKSIPEVMQCVLS
jgi:hypothetical protein